MRYFVNVGERTLELEVERTADGSLRVRGENGETLSAELIATRAGSFVFSLDGRRVEVQPSEQEVRLDGERFSATAQSERERATTKASAADSRAANEIVAPMPGRIVRVSCAPGDAVQKGAALVVIEAMKMQNELTAKRDGVVRAVRVANGNTVERGAVLIELE